MSTRAAPAAAGSNATSPPLMRRFVRALVPQSGLMRRLAMLVASTAAGQAILVIVSPLLTRLYTPEDFGYLAIFTTMLGMLSMVTCLRYEFAIPLCQSENEAHATAGVALLSAVLISALVATVILASSDALSRLVGLSASPAVLWLLPPSLLVLGVVTTLNAWVMRQNQLRKLAWGKLALAAGQAGAQTSLGLLSPTTLSLALGYTAGFLVSALVLMRRNRTFGLNLLTGANLNELIASAWRYRRFPMYSSVAALINSGNKLLPSFLLAVAYAPDIAGIYLLAQRVVGIPIRFVAISASQVFMAESARLANRDHDELLRVFVQTSLRLFWLGLVYLGTIALVGPWLFAVVFGEEWAPAGTVLRLLTPMYLAMFVQVPIQYTLSVLDRQDLAFCLDLLGSALMAASFGAGLLLDLEATAVIGLFSVGMTLSFSFYFIAAYRLLRASSRSRPMTLPGNHV